MKKNIISCLLIVSVISACGPKNENVIQQEDVAHIINTLAADSMMGRRTFTPGLRKAADFIEGKFKEIGLQLFKGEDDYRQQFEMVSAQPQDVAVKVNGRSVSGDEVITVSMQESLEWTNTSDVEVSSIEAGASLMGELRKHLNASANTLVWVDPSYAKQFVRFKGYLEGRSQFKNKINSNSVVFILSKPASRFNVDITNKLVSKTTQNIVGVLPGDESPEEYVVFSAHYDHIGQGEAVDGDSIFNGANDDASGTTAVIELAKYFKAKGGNNRTLVFVTFTGEEVGGYGSRYFSQQLDPEKVIAMFNIEMIGTTSKWGTNSAYITGYDKTDFGQILQKNLEGSNFEFHPDPYTKQNLFYRSDNATLARLGVPAHTISTSKMDSEPNYHKVSDEVSTLDLANMTEIIKSIAISSQSIISGEDTPSRVDTSSLR